MTDQETQFWLEGARDFGLACADAAEAGNLNSARGSAWYAAQCWLELGATTRVRAWLEVHAQLTLLEEERKHVL
jgi:hypothetical protein